jgi:ribose transport system permease protein
VGVPVDKVKIIVFVISGLMAGVCAVLTVCRLGGPTNTMGSFYEMKVMMAIFMGGVLVTGGMSTKIYKMLIGAFTIAIIENGLVLYGVSSELSEAVQGIALMVILFFVMFITERSKNPARLPDTAVAEATGAAA